MILTVGFWSFRKNNKKYPIFWEYDLTFSGFRVIDTIPKRKESVIMENKKLMTHYGSPMEYTQAGRDRRYGTSAMRCLKLMR